MEKDLNKTIIKCSLVCFTITFLFVFITLEVQQIDLIMRNSYYLSSQEILIKTLFWPLRNCLIYTAIIEIICQIIIRIKIKKQKEIKYIDTTILANVIGISIIWAIFVITLIVQS